MPEMSFSRDLAGLQVIDVLLVEDDPGDALMTTEASAGPASSRARPGPPWSS
jgi:hypothetical protein